MTKTKKYKVLFENLTKPLLMVGKKVWDFMIENGVSIESFDLIN